MQIVSHSYNLVLKSMGDKYVKDNWDSVEREGTLVILGKCSSSTCETSSFLEALTLEHGQEYVPKLRLCVLGLEHAVGTGLKSLEME